MIHYDQPQNLKSPPWEIIFCIKSGVFNGLDTFNTWDNILVCGSIFLGHLEFKTYLPSLLSNSIQFQGDTFVDGLSEQNESSNEITDSACKSTPFGQNFRPPQGQKWPSFET